MKVLNGRACRGEVEPFNQGELLEHLLDESGQRERLMATKAGELLERLTRYSYIKTLAFWVDLTAQGKIVSKIFQRSGLLLSDVSSGVEDAVAAIAKLKKEPGIFMKGLDTKTLTPPTRRSTAASCRGSPTARRPTTRWSRTSPTPSSST